MIRNILDNKIGRTSFFVLFFLLVISLVIVTAENAPENSTEEIIEVQPSETSNDVVTAETIPNEIAETETNVDDAISISENLTESENKTETIDSEEINETNQMPEIENTIQELPNLDVQIIHDGKITRGKAFEIKVFVENSGGEAGNVAVKLVLPKEFNVVSENVIFDCGDLGKGENCEAIFLAVTSLQTSLGTNEIKAEVSYE
jgi:hypothetical protein